MPKIIDSFRKEYFCFSNFYRRPILWKCHWFPTSEHAYHSEKSESLIYKYQLMSQHEINEWNRNNIVKCCEEFTVFKAKKYGNLERLKNLSILDPHWFDKSIRNMEEVIMYKFIQNRDLRKKLFDTENKVLIEGNNWGDVFFGCVKDKDGNWIGENHLGKILMRVRERLQYEISQYQSPCPECGSYRINYKFINCKCHITNDEGTEPTCWSYPICEDCGNEGYANSAASWKDGKSLWD